MASSRARRAQQPQYDFISGASEPPSQPSRESLRASSQTVRAVEDNEDLRKEIHKLRYEVDSLKHERDLTALRHEEAIRTAQTKADADYQRAQASESASHIAASKYESLSRELQETQARAADDSADLERKLRAERDQCQSLREAADEVREELDSRERHFKRDMDEFRAKHEPLQRAHEDLRVQCEKQGQAIQVAQQRLSEREEEVGGLEAELLRLKAQTGDAGTSAVIKRELSQQVDHIKTLESQNTKQRMELQQLREQRRAVEVVEEEKRMIEGRLAIMEDLRKELAEVQLQKQMLEDERRSWTSYLESEDSQGSKDEEMRFSSPEALAKAYLQERLERLSLVDQLGQVSPELASKDAAIQALERSQAQLRSELENSRVSDRTSDQDVKLRSRLERQRALAVQEVNYLRLQLQAFEVEEAENDPTKHDAQKTDRVSGLQNLVDQYRKELESTQSELEKAATPNNHAVPDVTTQSSAIGRKRLRGESDDEEERTGTLPRKMRVLQESLSQEKISRALLEKELEAANSQLASLKESSRTRILEFRANPTSNIEALKLAEHKKLREENSALLARLKEYSGAKTTGHKAPEEGTKSSSEKLVPYATVKRLKADLAAKEEQLSYAQKHAQRVKERTSSIIGEVREAVASILGWKLSIMQNGKVKVTSMFNTKTGQAQGAEDAPDEEKSIVFDGEAGTMKVSGGEKSAFAREIRGLIEYWVDGRREIPCFLAACTLEFWEKTQGTMKV